MLPAPLGRGLPSLLLAAFAELTLWGSPSSSSSLDGCYRLSRAVSLKPLALGLRTENDSK